MYKSEWCSLIVSRYERWTSSRNSHSKNVARGIDSSNVQNFRVILCSLSILVVGFIIMSMCDHVAIE